MSLRQLHFCFHASLFICHLLLSVSVCFFVFFSSCIKRNHFNRDGISYYTTLKNKIKKIISVDLFYGHFLLRWRERPLKLTDKVALQPLKDR